MCYLLTVFLKELFVITGLAILHIDCSGIVVVVDMLQQRLNFNDSLLCGLYGIRKLIETGRQLFGIGNKIIVIIQTFFLQLFLPEHQ